ncbi:MAG TPA: DUF2207 domain-containing protein [Candidatus Limnocylindria bacterium]|nr:DUF2207 domain-containing protein [Candidatus Limnocylindria bacterium]
MRRRGRGAAVAAPLALVAFLLLALPASADEGWVIDRFASDIAVQSDGSIVVTEAIDVDFQALTDRHGIFRDIPVRYRWDPDPKMERVYRLEVRSVQDANGRGVDYETSDEGANVRIKIGNADRTVRGKQAYRITYSVRGALNTFADHDELFWNVNGSQWSVPTRVVTASVRAPSDAFTQIACFQGPTGSKSPCLQSSLTPRLASFSSGQLRPGEQLTIVTAIRKGAVTSAAPILERRARGPDEWFDITPLTLGAAVFVLLVGLWLVVWRWWTAGRDERERETIVPEYEPPDKLRPAQVGLLVDESADTKDVTATIIDLAVRGFLSIAETKGEGLFAKQDWVLTRKRREGETLEPYERTILEGLFSSGDEVALSELRKKFYSTLGRAQRQLYEESVDRGWFPADPQRVRMIYAGLGVAALFAAGIAMFVLGAALGAGLVGVAAFVPAAALTVLAPRMPRKTRDGAELLRRTLGFRHYMEVAETERQRFAERENIFSEYLPYAIVFGCVDRWARAFSDIDTQAATASWYTGSTLGAFSTSDLSGQLSSFSNEVSSAIASTPGGSGSSGFSGGGSSGGGGGGGGGGSW